jgi:ribosomal protein S27AE
MPLERNLTQVDESCPECGTVLEEDPHDRLWCRDCGERKTV